MPVETAQTIADLNPLYPEELDTPEEGDEHLRLIKHILQNQFRQGTEPMSRILNIDVDLPAASLVLVTTNTAELTRANTAALVICNNSTATETPTVLTLPNSTAAVDGMYYRIQNARASGGAVQIALGTGESFAALGYSLTNNRYVLGSAGGEVTIIRLSGRWYLYGNITVISTELDIENEGTALSGAITFDAATGDIFYGTLTGNVTGITVSNMSPGQLIQVELKQGTGGNKTLTLGSLINTSYTDPPTLSTAAGVTDILWFERRADSADLTIYLAGFSKGSL